MLYYVIFYLWNTGLETEAENASSIPHPHLTPDFIWKIFVKLIHGYIYMVGICSTIRKQAKITLDTTVETTNNRRMLLYISTS